MVLPACASLHACVTLPARSLPCAQAGRAGIRKRSKRGARGFRFAHTSPSSTTYSSPAAVASAMEVRDGWKRSATAAVRGCSAPAPRGEAPLRAAAPEPPGPPADSWRASGCGVTMLTNLSGPSRAPARVRAKRYTLRGAACGASAGAQPERSERCPCGRGAPARGGAQRHVAGARVQAKEAHAAPSHRGQRRCVGHRLPQGLGRGGASQRTPEGHEQLRCARSAWRSTCGARPARRIGARRGAAVLRMRMRKPDAANSAARRAGAHPPLQLHVGAVHGAAVARGAQPAPQPPPKRGGQRGAAL